MKIIASIGLMVCLLATPAYGTMMYFLEVEDLTRLSTDIFRGRVVTANTYWNGGRTRIYTAIHIRIEESLKGATSRGATVTVTQPGGERDGVRMDYAGRPVFDPGESVVLFTIRGRNNDYIVVGLKQGKMNVDGDRVTRDFSGITLVQRFKGETRIKMAGTGDTRLTLAQLRARIARTR